MKTDPRSAACRTILVACALASLVSTQAAAEPNVAVRWNDTLLQAVRNTGFAPMFTARALGIVHTSMYDAWAAYDPVAVGTQFGGTLRRPESEQTVAQVDGRGGKLAVEIRRPGRDAVVLAADVSDARRASIAGPARAAAGGAPITVRSPIPGRLCTGSPRPSGSPISRPGISAAGPETPRMASVPE